MAIIASSHPSVHPSVLPSARNNNDPTTGIFAKFRVCDFIKSFTQSDFNPILVKKRTNKTFILHENTLYCYLQRRPNIYSVRYGLMPKKQLTIWASRLVRDRYRSRISRPLRDKYKKHNILLFTRQVQGIRRRYRDRKTVDDINISPAMKINKAKTAFRQHYKYSQVGETTGVIRKITQQKRQTCYGLHTFPNLLQLSYSQVYSVPHSVFCTARRPSEGFPSNDKTTHCFRLSYERKTLSTSVYTSSKQSGNIQVQSALITHNFSC